MRFIVMYCFKTLSFHSHCVFQRVMVEWDSDHRDCADLRGGASLFAADCEEYGPWACKKEY